MQDPELDSELFGKIAGIICSAKRPVPVEEIARVIGRSRDETNELLTQTGKRLRIRFVKVDNDVAVGLADGLGGVGE